MEFHFPHCALIHRRAWKEQPDGFEEKRGDEVRLQAAYNPRRGEDALGRAPDQNSMVPCGPRQSPHAAVRSRYTIPVVRLFALLLCRELDVFRLRAPRSPDGDQEGANNKEREHRVLEWHKYRHARLVKGVEGRKNDSEAVGQAIA